MKEQDTLHNIRHSLAHVLAIVVREKDFGVKFAIGPVIDTGFYYDFEFSKDIEIGEANLPKLEKRMREILKKGFKTEHNELSENAAREMFKDQPYKLELIDEIVANNNKITTYTIGDFTDLCEGTHVTSSKEIDPDAFSLSHIAGAYWRGDEKNTMLTRIYGLAFSTKKELDVYITQQEEAKKRDHRKLGKELDLFTFSELVGSGLPLWTPKGTILRNVLDDFVWQLRKKYGYMKVEIPHITKKDLYETSGHWDKFKDELFIAKSREGHEFVLKPMNCPHHTQIFKRKLHSYKEMPQRYANTTMVYRDEQTGELSGLSRVRSFTQDDAHVFCRYSQVKEEALKIWDIVNEFYSAVGFELQIRLSLRDPNEPDKYLGDSKIWKEAEDQLREIIKEKGFTVEETLGEAAFYGPKIDFIANDSLGRVWQLATIQLDLNLPERFDLTCINEKGKAERIVMLHAAIMGSLERYLAILIEHYAGAFPLWLSPVQVKVLPIGENHKTYAEEITRVLNEANIRVELDDNDETLGKKIRQTKLEKIPYFLVIGDKEVDKKEVTVETRENKKSETMSIENLIKKLLTEIEEKE